MWRGGGKGGGAGERVGSALLGGGLGLGRLGSAWRMISRDGKGKGVIGDLLFVAMGGCET